MRRALLNFEAPLWNNISISKDEKSFIWVVHLGHKHHWKISTLSRFKLELACVDLIQENEMRPLNPTVNFSPVYFIIKWFKTGPDTCLNFLHVQTYFDLVWFCISRVFKGHEMSIFESWYVVFIFMDLQSFLRSIYELSRSFWALFKYSSLLLLKPRQNKKCQTFVEMHRFLNPLFFVF